MLYLGFVLAEEDVVELAQVEVVVSLGPEVPILIRSEILQ
jgi:hypothetical protein